MFKLKNKRGGITDFNSVSSKDRLENFHRISELSRELTESLSEIVFGDLKRTYNMSKLASNGMVSTVQCSDGTTRKDITYAPNYTMSKNITDLLGNTISIHHVGRLDYKCSPSSDNYISMFRISKHAKDEMIMEPCVVFSNINMNMLDDPSYREVITNTLLSNNNIELSHADGYIGEIHSQSTLNVGEEKFVPGFYTYQASPEYALVYDGEKIEAVKAYKKELAKAIKEKKDDER